MSAPGFHRCARCGRECHASYQRCPDCDLAFDSAAQREADARLGRSLDAQAAQERADLEGLARTRARAGTEERAALDRLSAHEQAQALERERVVGDLLDGEPLRHLAPGRERAQRWNDPTLDREHGHHLDRRIDELERRAASPAPLRPAQAPAGDATTSMLVGLGLVLAFVGAMLAVTGSHLLVGKVLAAVGALFVVGAMVLRAVKKP